MGEKVRRLSAQKRLLDASLLCELDLTDCAFVLSDSDRAQLSANNIPAELAIARILISQAVQAAYPEGLDRRDGQLFAGWQESLEAEHLITAEGEARYSVRLALTQGQVDWLHRLLAKDELKLPAGLAQWREALIEYLAERLAQSHSQASSS